MLTSNHSKRRKSSYRLSKGTTLKKIKVSLFHFPFVQGLEDISQKLSLVEADSLFTALLKLFRLRPIETEKEARDAERILEYIDRAFEKDIPLEIDHFRQVLLMLVTHFDEKHYRRAAGDLEPAEFLKALLKEEGISQKELVPECFKSESQVSEFLHQKKGRKDLSYQQAAALGRRFAVDPLNFLRT